MTVVEEETIQKQEPDNQDTQCTSTNEQDIKGELNSPTEILETQAEVFDKRAFNDQPGSTLSEDSSTTSATTADLDSSEKCTTEAEDNKITTSSPEVSTDNGPAMDEKSLAKKVDKDQSESKADDSAMSAKNVTECINDASKDDIAGSPQKDSKSEIKDDMKDVDSHPEDMGTTKNLTEALPAMKIETESTIEKEDIEDEGTIKVSELSKLENNDTDKVENVSNHSVEKGSNNATNAMPVVESNQMSVQATSPVELPVESLTVDCRPSTSENSGPMTEERFPSASQPGDSDTSKNIYHVKWIEFGLRNAAIITQNENGPCPLISIVNILLLRGKLSLPEGCEIVSGEQLLEYLGDLILNLSGENTDPDLQRNINDAVAVLPRLSTGLDVNVKFTGVGDFEYTPEMLIFDVLHINLYHGWLVDPQIEDLVLAVNSLSYNQLVEKIISNTASTDSELYSQSLVAQQFLEESASQLTYHGLYELNSKLEEQTLAVFFRNNHFSTIFKKNGELFLLVTDQGFLGQKEVVWETLANIEGDSHFVNHLFQSTGVDPRVDQKTACDPESALEQDRLLAETLQREAQEVEQRENLFEEFKQNHLGEGLTDEELAMKLQEVENRAAQEEQRSAEQSTSSSRPAPGNPIGPRPPKKDKNCVIL